jgi:hypothetical protein
MRAVIQETLDGAAQSDCGSKHKNNHKKQHKNQHKKLASRLP